jgi:hypothetical protein
LPPTKSRPFFGKNLTLPPLRHQANNNKSVGRAYKRYPKSGGGMLMVGSKSKKHEIL